jgi:hypothetical protein
MLMGAVPDDVWRRFLLEELGRDVAVPQAPGGVAVQLAVPRGLGAADELAFLRRQHSPEHVHAFGEDPPDVVLDGLVDAEVERHMVVPVDQRGHVRAGVVQLGHAPARVASAVLLAVDLLLPEFLHAQADEVVELFHEFVGLDGDVDDLDGVAALRLLGEIGGGDRGGGHVSSP